MDTEIKDLLKSILVHGDKVEDIKKWIVNFLFAQIPDSDKVSIGMFKVSKSQYDKIVAMKKECNKDGYYITAIKELRTMTGGTLKDCKDAIDGLMV